MIFLVTVVSEDIGSTVTVVRVVISGSGSAVVASDVSGAVGVPMIAGSSWSNWLPAQGAGPELGSGSAEEVLRDWEVDGRGLEPAVFIVLDRDDALKPNAFD